MYQCLKAGFMAFCVAAAASACDWGNGGSRVDESGAATSSQTPTIESSLEGLTDLPPRIRWSATTSLPPEQVDVVQFFIDGSRWWEDSGPPYTYGPADAYLPARWLATRIKRPEFRLSRTHDFMVRVKATDGEKWESAVAHVRTPKATFPRPPGGFGGQWGSNAYVKLSRSDLANPPPPGSYPFHGGYLVFIANSIFVRGGVHEGAWEIGGDDKRMRLGTPIFFRERAYAAPGSGFDGIEGVLCGSDGPPATYAWSQTKGRLLSVYEGVSRYARNLELRAVTEPCAERQRLLEGVWERTGPD